KQAEKINEIFVARFRSIEKQTPQSERRLPAAKIQPWLDFSGVALGDGTADSGNSFLSAAGDAAAQRIGARSPLTLRRGAADLSGGFDRRHHQVAHGSEFGGRTA